MSEIVSFGGGDGQIVLETRDGAAPVWRWWGPPVDAAALPPLAHLRPGASFSVDQPVPLPLVPGFGAGWFGAPGLEIHRGGRAFATRLLQRDIEEHADQLIVTLADTAAEIAVIQRIARVPGGLAFSATLINDGATPLALGWLAAGTLPLPGDCSVVRSFTGRHNAEFQRADEALPAHGWLRENRRGLTGHAGPPGVFVATGVAGWHGGRVHAAQLAWSGNHRLRIDRDDAGGWTLQMGELLAPGEISLAPGERYETPEMLIACTADEGFNGAIQRFHAMARARAPWPAEGMRPRPVHLNSWEGFYFDHDEAALMALASRVADLGVERFVLDDGWFAGRDDDTTSLGDWTPDARKYPRGLGPLADHVVSCGMEFGLWVEPEMVSPDSDLYRAHPEWALRADGIPLLTARQQLVLDLGRAEVRDHLFDALDALLRALPIAYLKWDHNRDLAPAGGADGRAGYHAQVCGLYALIDRLRTAHPAVEIEACAGGGGRTDAGIATRTHRFWTSDCIDAVSRVGMQRGFLHFLPPEMMGAHVGASPAHSTGRSQSMAFRAAVALPGHLGIELDPAQIDATDAQVLADGLRRYKSLRDRLHAGKVWLGEAPDGIVWQAHGAVDALLLSVTRVVPTGQRFPPAVVLPMLAGAGRTRVRLIDLASVAGHPPGQAAGFGTLSGEGMVFDGDWLAQAGLPLPAMKAESVALFDLTAA